MTAARESPGGGLAIALEPAFVSQVLFLALLMTIAAKAARG
jgi:hypothetical protein